MTAPTRPVMRYHGGKWRLAPWVISHFPPHDIYVELFGGAGSVLMRKPRSRAEVYNDLDDAVVNVFRVLRDPRAASELERLIRLTPYAKAELEESYQPTDEPIERARRMLVRAGQGFSSAGATRNARVGFRRNATRSHTLPVDDWCGWPEQIRSFTARLQGVVIEHSEAVKLIPSLDGPRVLFYADPPYVHSTRTSIRSEGGGDRFSYRHEMGDDAHRALLEALTRVDGMVVLSGYPSKLYDDLLGDWIRVERPAMADGAKPRLELLWLNPAAEKGLVGGTLGLGGGHA